MGNKIEWKERKRERESTGHIQSAGAKSVMRAAAAAAGGRQVITRDNSSKRVSLLSLSLPHDALHTYIYMYIQTSRASVKKEKKRGRRRGEKRDLQMASSACITAGFAVVFFSFVFFVVLISFSSSLPLALCLSLLLVVSFLLSAARPFSLSLCRRRVKLFLYSLLVHTSKFVVYNYSRTLVTFLFLLFYFVLSSVQEEVFFTTQRVCFLNADGY